MMSTHNTEKKEKKYNNQHHRMIAHSQSQKTAENILNTNCHKKGYSIRMTMKRRGIDSIDGCIPIVSILLHLHLHLHL